MDIIVANLILCFVAFVQPDRDFPLLFARTKEPLSEFDRQ